MEMRDYTDLLRKLQVKLDTSDLGQYGILPAEKADEFIDLTLKKSVLLSAVTTQRVDDRAGEFYYFDLPGHVITAAPAEGTTPVGGWTDTGTITIDKAFEYSCTKIATYFSMTWEMINWALTAPEFEDFLVQRWTERLAEDLEALGIVGTGTGSGFAAIDAGWLYLIENATGTNPPFAPHIIDWVDNTGAPKPVDHTLFQTAYKAFITDPYCRAMVKKPVWMCNATVYVDYMHYLAGRGDALGAAAMMGAAELRPEGVPFFNGPAGLPDIPITTDTNNNLVTKMLLGDPKHLWLVIHREFRLERQRNIYKDAWEWIGYGYVDYVVPFPGLFVLVTNIKVGTAP